MKIICIENSFADCGEIYLTVRPDTAVLRENDDFYMPTFSNDIACGGGILVRINRLAKCIDSKFAGRCYDNIGAGVAFIADDIRRQHLSAGRPCDEAYCFDRSLALSPKMTAKEGIADAEISVAIGKDMQSAHLSQMRLSIDECVSRASQLATLKSGDIVYIGMPMVLHPNLGDNVKVCIAGEELLNFRIK